MTALITIASVLAYLGCLVFSARWRYRRIRPWTEPLSCTTPYSCSGASGHYVSCYRRYELIDTTNEAVAFSILFGLLGPFSFTAIIIGKILHAAITSGTQPTQKELEAKVARLERELGMGKDHDH